MLLRTIAASDIGTQANPRLYEPLAADPLRLFDVGARGGIAGRWRGLEDYIEVLGFEPDPRECARLNRETGKRELYLPCAVGAERATVPFHVTAWPVASSIYPTDPAFLRGFSDGELLRTVETREIETTTLDHVCDERATRPDLLKLDVEGAELDVLRGADRVVRTALAIDVEVAFAPLRIGAPSFSEIDGYVRARGFSLAGLRRVFWRQSIGDLQRPMLVQGDALYLNERVAEKPDPTLRAKLGLILAAYAPEVATGPGAWEDAGFL